ncbi:basic proline-rich protein-like [Suncus etruscus]|uniref:basic proline-rich protein-like n=1 Tax=Suncus etruscus TaxID=109475 RepID=UPI002110A98A|nr:basic proline-rich protein-like [Suncus etruscus]
MDIGSSEGVGRFCSKWQPGRKKFPGWLTPTGGKWPRGAPQNSRVAGAGALRAARATWKQPAQPGRAKPSQADRAGPGLPRACGAEAEADAGQGERGPVPREEGGSDGLPRLRPTPAPRAGRRAPLTSRATKARRPARPGTNAQTRGRARELRGRPQSCGAGPARDPRQSRSPGRRRAGLLPRGAPLHPLASRSATRRAPGGEGEGEAGDGEGGSGWTNMAAVPPPPRPREPRSRPPAPVASAAAAPRGPAEPPPGAPPPRRPPEPQHGRPAPARRREGGSRPPAALTSRPPGAPGLLPAARPARAQLPWPAPPPGPAAEGREGRASLMTRLGAPGRLPGPSPASPAPRGRQAGERASATCPGLASPRLASSASAAAAAAAAARASASHPPPRAPPSGLACGGSAEGAPPCACVRSRGSERAEGRTELASRGPGAFVPHPRALARRTTPLAVGRAGVRASWVALPRRAPSPPWGSDAAPPRPGFHLSCSSKPGSPGPGHLPRARSPAPDAQAAPPVCSPGPGLRGSPEGNCGEGARGRVFGPRALTEPARPQVNPAARPHPEPTHPGRGRRQETKWRQRANSSARLGSGQAASPGPARRSRPPDVRRPTAPRPGLQHPRPRTPATQCNAMQCAAPQGHPGWVGCGGLPGRPGTAPTPDSAPAPVSAAQPGGLCASGGETDAGEGPRLPERSLHRLPRPGRGWAGIAGSTVPEVRVRADRLGADLPAPRGRASHHGLCGGRRPGLGASAARPLGSAASLSRAGIGPRHPSRARIVGLGSAPPAGQTPTPPGRCARGPLSAGWPSSARAAALPMVQGDRGFADGARGSRLQGLATRAQPKPWIPSPAFPPPPTPPRPPPPPQLAPGHRAHLGSSQVPRVLRASWLPKEKPPLAAIKIPPPPESLQ